VGTTFEDRLVIQTLLRNPRRLRNGEVRYAMSETTLCAAVGVDPGTYKSQMQPRLFRLGLLATLGGQALTDRAVECYAALGEK
jgi:hypothetical protein